MYSIKILIRFAPDMPDTATKSNLSVAAKLSSAAAIEQVAPAVVAVQLEDRRFAGVPSSRCRLMTGEPASVSAMTSVMVMARPGREQLEIVSQSSESFKPVSRTRAKLHLKVLLALGEERS